MAGVFDTFEEGYSRTSIIDESSNATLMGWFHVSGAPAASTFRTFIYYGNDPITDYTQYVWIGHYPSGNIRLEVTDGSGFPSIAFGETSPITAAGWHHLAYVRNGTSHKLYLDGTEVVSVTADLSAQAFTHILLGHDGYANDWDPTKVAYYREWNSALTLAEIDAEIIATSPVKASPYQVSSFAANAQDSSGNGRHWTTVGTVSYEAQPQWIYARPSEAITVAEGTSFRYADAVRLSVNDTATVVDSPTRAARNIFSIQHGVQAHVMRISGTSSTTAVRYCSPAAGQTSWYSSQAAASPRMPCAGFWRNLKIVLGTSPGSGRSRNYRVYVNNVASPMQVTISDTNLEGQYTARPIPVGPEDEIVLVMTPSGTPSADSGGTHIAIEFEGFNAGESVHIPSGSANSPSASVTNYVGIFQLDGVWGTNNNNVRSIIAVEGDVIGYAIDSSIAPAGANPFTFYLYKNGVRQDGSGGTPNTQLVISSTNRNDYWSGEISASPGDFFSVQCVPSGGSTFPIFPIGVAFRADVDGESHFGCHPTSLSNTVDGYYPPPGDASSTTDTVEAIGTITTFTLKELWLENNNAPGGAASRTFMTRKNNADTSLSVVISGAGTSGSDLVGPVTITQTDRWGLKHTPAGSPATGAFPALSWKQYVVPGSSPLSIDVSDAVTVSETVITSPMQRAVHDDITVTEFRLATNNGQWEAVDAVVVADAVTATLQTVRIHTAVHEAITVTESRTALLVALRLSVNKFETIDASEAALRVFKAPMKRTIPDFIRVRDAVTVQTRIGGGIWVRVHETITVRESPLFSGHASASTSGTATGVTTDGTGYSPGVTTVNLAATGTGSINVGDVITFVGSGQQYVVTEGDTDVSNGGTISFTPGLVVAIPATPTGIVLVPSSPSVPDPGGVVIGTSPGVPATGPGSDYWIDGV